MNWKEYKQQLLKDPAVRREYEALEPEFQLAAALMRLRLAKGLTQEQLAERLHTKQESIARLESGSSLPSLSTVKKVADALDATLEIYLRPKGKTAEPMVVRDKARTKR
jgi:transcriptional regulator with XRE-family HTH domain